MNALQRERINKQVDAICDSITEIPGYFSDPELRATFAVVHSLRAALLHDEVENLARCCADWCHATAEKVTQAG